MKYLHESETNLANYDQAPNTGTSSWPIDDSCPPPALLGQAWSHGQGLEERVILVKVEDLSVSLELVAAA